MGSLLLPTVLVALGSFFFICFLRFDANKVVHSHKPGVCRVVEGPVHGSEDVDLVKSEGLAFISSGINFLHDPHHEGVKGQIFLYDFGQPSNGKPLKAVPLPIKGDFDVDNFHPHGISHWIVDGRIRLFAINHDNKFKHSVEIFDFDSSGPTLIHKKTVKGDLLIRPNDVAAIGPEQFIVTNDGVSQTMLGNFFEYLFSYRGGSLTLYDGKSFHSILDSLKIPSGIVFDGQKNLLFITEALAETVNAYQISKDFKSLRLLSTTPVYTTADNLSLEGDGLLLLGAHPLMYEAAPHLGECENKQLKSSSQVLRLKYTNVEKPATITEVYVDDGSQASGSSSAVHFDGQLLIGTVCRSLVHCRVKDPVVLA